MKRNPIARAIKLFIPLIALSLITGCSQSPQGHEAPQIPDSSQIDNNSVDPNDDSLPSSPTQNQDVDTAKDMLLNIKDLAKEGKIINSNFPVKTTVIDDVEKELGQPDKVDWVPDAKGNYATFEKHDLVFGFNKGSQIFEARSYDEQLQNINLSKTKEVYGAPEYDINVRGEKIIGYVVNEEFKLEFVFPEPTNDNPNPKLDHYLVLYPRGTVNQMANDLGRQW